MTDPSHLGLAYRLDFRSTPPHLGCVVSPCSLIFASHFSDTKIKATSISASSTCSTRELRATSTISGSSVACSCGDVDGVEEGSEFERPLGHEISETMAQISRERAVRRCAAGVDYSLVRGKDRKRAKVQNTPALPAVGSQYAGWPGPPYPRGRTID